MEPRARQTIAHRELLLPKSQQADEPLFLEMLFRGGHRQTTGSLSQLFLWLLARGVAQIRSFAVQLGSARRNATIWHKGGRRRTGR
eukprot:3064847-Alexandrium_andersonii.AAC.1